MLGLLPAPRVAEITRELVRRGEYVTVGEFVGHVSDDAVLAAVEEMDDSALLRVAFVLDTKENIERLVGLLPPHRLDGVMQTAAAEHLWVEVLDLLIHLEDGHRAALVERAAELDDMVLDSLVTAAQQDMWDAVVMLLRSTSLQTRRRFASLGSLREDGVLEGLVAATAELDMWPEVIPLVPMLPPDAQQRVADACTAAVDRPRGRHRPSSTSGDDGATDTAHDRDQRRSLP